MKLAYDARSAACPGVPGWTLGNHHLMGTDHDWVAINEVVEAGLRDANVLADPPTTDEELGYVAERLTDHLVTALARGHLAKRDGW